MDDDRMDDDRLEALARRLGENAERLVSPDRVVEGVLDRLRSEPGVVVSQPRWGMRYWARWAAAAALVAAAGLGIGYYLVDRTDTQPEVVALADGLGELAATELAEVMDSLEVQAPVAEFVVGLDDLSEEQLELLLQRLEG